MNRIDATFQQLRRRKKKALIPYLTVGFPSVALLPALVRAMVEAGADLIELGVPFSDPLADGPTIQAASSWALRQGVTPGRVIRSVENLRRRGIEVPLVLMTYYNPVFRYGVKAFCRDCSTAGVDGLIVPDLPPEEADELRQSARSRGLDAIFLAAPTSPGERLRRIARASSGFVYDVSLTGVTGARNGLPPGLEGHVRMLRGMTTLPVCVGFGISDGPQVRLVTRVADGAIVGSALLNVIGKSARDPVKQAASFIRKLKAACDEK